jgi:hypothetical protein
MHLLRVTPDEYLKKYYQFLEMADFMDLSDSDRHLAWAEATSDDDWNEWPVPIQHFITDPYYIGTDVVVRPAIRNFLTDFWDVRNAYQLWVFIGGIGAGKSFSASISITYAIYLLSCMKSPQKYLSTFPGCQLSNDAEIVLMNASAAGAEQSRKIVYGEAFEKIQKSPYFSEFYPPYPRKMSELDFPGRIRLSPGTSNWQRALGWNLFGFAIDEAAFGRETERADYVKELFLALNQRRRSRFGQLGFGGMFTSPGSESGFVELIADDADQWDTSIMVRRITTWEAKDELKEGSECFLLDRNPDRVRIIETGLTYIDGNEDGGVAQRKTGELVRWGEIAPLASPDDEEVEAVIASKDGSGTVRA